MCTAQTSSVVGDNTYGVVTNKMDEAGSCPTVDMSTAMCTAQTSSVVGDNTNNGNNTNNGRKHHRLLVTTLTTATNKLQRYNQKC